MTGPAGSDFRAASPPPAGRKVRAQAARRSSNCSLAARPLRHARQLTDVPCSIPRQNPTAVIMSHPIAQPIADDAESRRAEDLFCEHQLSIYQRADRIFAVLMPLQWMAAIATALWISPRTWAG